MSAWPESMKIGPIGEWPGALTASRQVSPFQATLSATLSVLEREIRFLSATTAQRQSAELLIAIPAGGFRLDGRPRADARPEHPGVIFSIDSRHGHLSYPCDRFTTWQDNLRAIALALEALRKVDRYGVTKRGEQYRGFLAIEATAAPAGFADAEDALRHVMRAAGMVVDPAIPASKVFDRDDIRQILRRAKFHTHPDRGGDPVDFQHVSLAETQIREAGLL